MIPHHILQDSELEKHIDTFNFPLEVGKKECLEQLQTKFSSSKRILEKRQNDIRLLRKNMVFCRQTLDELKTLKDDETLLLSYKRTDSTKAGEGQVFFSGEYTKVFNFIPYLISCIVFLKVYISPILGLLTPLILFVMPYVILKTMFGQDMPWDMYIVMMKHMMFGLKAGEPFTMRQGFQAFWTALSLGQGMIQPFLTAYHTTTVDKTITERGNALLRIHSLTNDIYTKCKSLNILSDCPLVIPDVPDDPRIAAAWMDAEPLGVLALWKILGKLTLLFTFAADKTWSFVYWRKEPQLYLSGFSDIAIQPEKRIESSIFLKSHSLLTGPNRGGKSSNLRAILQQIILGQTFGITRFCQGSWLPFTNLFTRLKSYDHSGKESLFEMEVRHAANMIHKLKASTKHSLVLIDELFHSTNPPDAETSATLFLRQLCQFSHVKSIISTHIFSLCEDCPSNVETFCCPAEELDDGKISYSYMLQSGICHVSSVREVLSEAGLCG